MPTTKRLSLKSNKPSRPVSRPGKHPTDFQPRSLQQALSQLDSTPETLRQLIQVANDKSWPLWTIELKASRAEKGFILSVGLAAIVAWWLSELHLSLHIIGTLGLVTGIAAAFVSRDHPATLSYFDNGTWQWTTPNGLVSGMSAKGCYLSTYLLVLLIRTTDGKKIRITVWRDSVSRADFSQLYLRLFLTPRASLQS